MGYDVVIRRNSDGLERTYRMDDMNWYDDESETDDAFFWWKEGNMSCDCNRLRLFERAGGNEPDRADISCSEIKYSVLRAILPDGRVVTIDEENP